ncbi:PaaI family thioesterase [Numidum massiliense]|uniref:PaaI family thioesterase n=1 Tax=Numidum massiliense TaxID=1522315 RepID=UPI0006D59DB1|nr:PaaI family thioesterase [Numidum massiliense]
MLKKFTVTDLQNVARGGMAPPPCDDTMQLTVHSAENGVAKGTWCVDRKYINGLGVAMGGFLSAAADIMMAYAISSMLKEPEGFASIDLDTTFHRPTFEGEVAIEAVVEKRGRKLAYVVADLTQNDKLVATCVSSILIHGG